MDQTYKQFHDVAIRDLLHEYECQPILFIGSGISRRYSGVPTWMELLEQVYNIISTTDSLSFHYLKQKYDSKPEDIGSALATSVFEWAWKQGKDFFPASFFQENISRDKFIKYMCCEIVKKSIDVSIDKTSSLYREISALQEIRPHAIITTNYDLFLESIFSGYENISGQQILRYNSDSFGEIFHIHGDITNPDSIILTREDYKNWDQKKKYVSAKLLTYFAEHPVFIFGYSVSDHNVKSILKDIAEILDCGDGMIPNIYHIIWDPEKDGNGRPSISIIQHEEKEYKIKAVYTADFRWVFEALRSKTALSSVNTKLIRALAARTFKLIRSDIPTGSVKVNYDVLERVANETDHLPNLLGISVTSNANLSHPFTMTQVAKNIGVESWWNVNKIVNKIKEETGVDIRSTDNIYHCQIKTGEKGIFRKWSHQAVELFSKINNGEEYRIDPELEISFRS